MKTLLNELRGKAKDHADSSSLSDWTQQANRLGCDVTPHPEFAVWCCELVISGAVQQPEAVGMLVDQLKKIIEEVSLG